MGGDLNPGERHSRDTRDDGTVTLCTLRAATVLSRDCRAHFGRRLTKKVMSHSRDGPGVTAPSRTNIAPLTGVWNQVGGQSRVDLSFCVVPCFAAFRGPKIARCWEKQHEKCHCQTPFCVLQMLVKTRI